MNTGWGRNGSNPDIAFHSGIIEEVRNRDRMSHQQTQVLVVSSFGKTERIWSRLRSLIKEGVEKEEEKEEEEDYHLCLTAVFVLAEAPNL